jgi:hypothetical protein
MFRLRFKTGGVAARSEPIFRRARDWNAVCYLVITQRGKDGGGW